MMNKYKKLDLIDVEDIDEKIRFGYEIDDNSNNELWKRKNIKIFINK